MHPPGGLSYSVSMQIPGVGEVLEDHESGWLRSAAMPVPVLGRACHILVAGYLEDPAKEDFHRAISDFLTLDASALASATAPVFEYYRDVMAEFDPADEWYVAIAGPDEVWRHIEIGDEVMVRRDGRGGRVYVTVECECDWEPEHGLQIVFRDGRAVSRVGPYDGHLTNANAYGRDDLEGVVYPGTAGPV